MSEKQNGVEIHYSAEEQKELEEIRAKYRPEAQKGPTNLEKARRLDERAESRAMLAGLCTGIIGTLIMGVGMTCFLVWRLPVLGVLVGLIGLAGIGAAWPLYQRVLKKERDRVAPEILRLTEE